MEIIKRGQIPSDKLWLGTCQTCHSVARAKQSELTNITDDQREGTRFSWEKCPVCGAAGGAVDMLFYPEMIMPE